MTMPTEQVPEAKIDISQKPVTTEYLKLTRPQDEVEAKKAMFLKLAQEAMAKLNKKESNNF